MSQYMYENISYDLKFHYGLLRVENWSSKVQLRTNETPYKLVLCFNPEIIQPLNLPVQLKNLPCLN